MVEWVKELWERKAQSEKGEEAEKYPDVFVWGEQIKKDEALKKFFEIVCKQIERFARTIEGRQKAQESFDKEGKSEEAESELKSADQSQRLAHKALVSAINFFTRNCEQKGIKIDIDLEKVKNRDWSRDWAMKNAEMAEKIVEQEAALRQKGDKKKAKGEKTK